MSSRRQLWRAFALVIALSSLCVFAAQKGTWTADFVRNRPGELNLQLRTGVDGQGSSWGETLPQAELRGLADRPEGDVEFRVVRDAGTLVLRGRFEDGRGAGHFTFEESPAFTRRMAELGYPDWTPEERLLLFTTNMKPAWIDGLRTLGYREITKARLIEVALFEVTPEVIRGYAAAGYRNLPLEDVIKLRVHQIDPEWIARMRGTLAPR